MSVGDHVLRAYLSVFPVEVLPDEVHAVDLAMVLVEGRLEGGEVEVSSRFATCIPLVDSSHKELSFQVKLTDSVVPTAMHGEPQAACLWVP